MEAAQKGEGRWGQASCDVDEGLDQVTSSAVRFLLAVLGRNNHCGPEFIPCTYDKPTIMLFCHDIQRQPPLVFCRPPLLLSPFSSAPLLPRTGPSLSVNRTSLARATNSPVYLILIPSPYSAGPDNHCHHHTFHCYSRTLIHILAEHRTPEARLDRTTLRLGSE